MTGCVDENLFAFIFFFAYKHKLNENPRRFEDIFGRCTIAVVLPVPKLPITIRTHSNISIQCSSDTKINLLHILCRHCFDSCAFSTILSSDEDTVRISFSRNACKWNPSNAEYHIHSQLALRSIFYAHCVQVLHMFFSTCSSQCGVRWHIYNTLLFQHLFETEISGFDSMHEQHCTYECVLATIPTSSTILLIFSAGYSPNIIVFQVKVQICSSTV